MTLHALLLCMQAGRVTGACEGLPLICYVLCKSNIAYTSFLHENHAVSMSNVCTTAANCWMPTGVKTFFTCSVISNGRKKTVQRTVMGPSTGVPGGNQHQAAQMKQGAGNALVRSFTESCTLLTQEV